MEEEIGSLASIGQTSGRKGDEVTGLLPGSVFRSRPPKPDVRVAVHSAFHQRLRLADERRAFGILTLEKRIRIREHQRLLQDFGHVLDLNQGDVLQHLLRNFVDRRCPATTCPTFTLCLMSPTREPARYHLTVNCIFTGTISSCSTTIRRQSSTSCAERTDSSTRLARPPGPLL